MSFWKKLSYMAVKAIYMVLCDPFVVAALQQLPDTREQPEVDEIHPPPTTLPATTPRIFTPGEVRFLNPRVLRLALQLLQQKKADVLYLN